MAKLMLSLAALACAVGLQGETLPYKLIEPANPHTLVIALHGALHNPDMVCGVLTLGKLKKTALERGYLVACPTDLRLGPIPHYELIGAELVAMRDDIVKKFPTVKQVFLYGHSMGGRGVLLLAQKYPDKFDGVAAIAPALKVVLLYRKAVETIVPVELKDLKTPTFIAFARNDLVVEFPADYEERLCKATTTCKKYIATHTFMVGASLDDTFRFFDGLRAEKK
jgi:hypothetical protein